ncbi:GntR family transcriptional regulator [Caballeronia ptereochthonis]|uniref:GntR family transcriptional regulator n=1 Tax=Caballeronia ptereochthonis TaxID=1777144 RepID=A0A158AIF3_9BURK|nr:GntR family transcriptional regulator [Caballeronia ptereochthonis]SAK57550.1 GntR family transcriptional regulator [Caballeronia ptereochthonis]
MNAVSSLAPGIDRSSPVPYYLQLSQLMMQAIDRGDYAPGDRLPSESDLCRDYELARSTVRETLRHLADQGKVKMIPRRGAFVAEQAQSGWTLQVAQGFFEAEVEQHRSVETKVLEAERCILPDAVAQALDLDSGIGGFRLARVRRLDGQLALYSVNYLLLEIESVLRSSEVLTSGASLNRTLKAAGYEVFRARRGVEAVAATRDLSTLLEVPVGSPLLLVTSVSWGADGKPFDFYTSWLRSDVVKVTVDAQAALNND